jgi:hypothetical protein
MDTTEVTTSLQAMSDVLAALIGRLSDAQQPLDVQRLRDELLALQHQVDQLKQTPMTERAPETSGADGGAASSRPARRSQAGARKASPKRWRGKE